MDGARLRALLRFDSGIWRRFAQWGCVHGPEWWKRGSPPVIAGVIYAIARDQGSAVRRNLARIRGSRPVWREHWEAYRVFAQFARSLTEALEQWGPRPPPIAFTVRNRAALLAALDRGRGVVVVTGHFGSWDVGARELQALGRPVTLVMAREPNETVRTFMSDLRTRNDVRILYSGESVLSGLPILHALRRGEIVCMQIERWGGLSGTHETVLFGHPALFQLGPFVVARAARVPVVPVFCMRRGIRRYELVIGDLSEPRTRAEAVVAFERTMRMYEALIRDHPDQWLVFEDAWRTSVPPNGSSAR